MVGRRLYFVFCISLQVEDKEKTHETTGIGVIEGVPMFTLLLVPYVCTMYKPVYGGAIVIVTKHTAIFSIINLVVFFDYGDF